MPSILNHGPSRSFAVPQRLVQGALTAPYPVRSQVVVTARLSEDTTARTAAAGKAGAYRIDSEALKDLRHQVHVTHAATAYKARCVADATIAHSKIVSGFAQDILRALEQPSSFAKLMAFTKVSTIGEIHPGIRNALIERLNTINPDPNHAPYLENIARHTSSLTERID